MLNNIQKYKEMNINNWKKTHKIPRTKLNKKYIEYINHFLLEFTKSNPVYDFNQIILLYYSSQCCYEELSLKKNNKVNWKEKYLNKIQQLLQKKEMLTKSISHQRLNNKEKKILNKYLQPT